MKHKILSFLTAFAMVFGIIAAPFVNASAADESTEKVTVHKILQSESSFKKWPAEGKTNGEDKKEYIGEDIKKSTIENYGKENASKSTSTIESFFGSGAEDIGDVYFAWAKKGTDNKYYWIAKGGNFTEPKTEVDEKKLDEIPNDTLGAFTVKDSGAEFTTKGFDGEYKIYEIHSKSKYVGKDGKILTDIKAVPVAITLPLVNENGVVKDAHVYPKNTEDKPKIDKNFKKADTTKNEKELEVAEGFDAAEEGAGIGVGANYDNYAKKKAAAKAEIGKKIPYEVKTEIPAKSKLAEAHWDDKMTEGLTYNKDLKVTIGGTEITPSSDELVQTDNGFSLRLKGDNLALLNNKEAAVTVVLTYTATVNSKSIVDIPEANDITFHYGNTPSKGNTPLPVKPNENGEVTVKKTWDNGVWADGETATFELRDANTGEVVKAKDLVYTGSDTDETAKKVFEDYKKSFSATANIGYNAKDGATHTWKYLNKDKQYKAVETNSTTPSDAEYTKAADGTIEVTNHKSTNPKPLNPTEPKVVTGGKKFVKTDNVDGDKAKRLVGAQFIVLDSTGKKYLVAKSSTEANAANVDVTTAKKNLDDAVKAYNELSADEQKGEKGTKAKGDIDTAQQKYNKAVKDAAKAYKFVDLPAQLEDKKAPEGAVVLTSDSEGKFEITGLEYGDYKLKEILPPSGFAKLNGDVPFNVAKGSYAGNSAKEFKYEVKVDTTKGEKQTYGKQIKNKKVSIPQTGGIGSIIFVVAGLMIMGLAAYKMKANKEQA